jgi:hypothetical protein
MKMGIEQPEAHQILEKIQEAVLEAIRSGIPKEEVFAALRAAVREADTAKLGNHRQAIESIEASETS